MKNLLYSTVYDLNTTICRFFNVYGPHHVNEGEYATVIAIWERQYLNGDPITITNDGKQKRDFTNVEDVADALVRCIGKDFRAEIFDLGSGVNYSINELADAFGKDYPKEYIGHRDGEYPATLGDSSKAKELLGWESQTDIKDYINKWIGDKKNV